MPVSEPYIFRIAFPGFRFKRALNLSQEVLMTNDNAPSYTLTFDDAVQVWLRYWGGEFQNRIAASLDVNPARVNEVLKERKFRGSRAAALSQRTA
jgi:hypothetical protein